MLNDFDDVNRILAEMAERDIVEPCDEAGSHPLDWADAVGIFDEIAEIIYGDPV